MRFSRLGRLRWRLQLVVFVSLSAVGIGGGWLSGNLGWQSEKTARVAMPVQLQAKQPELPLLNKPLLEQALALLDQQLAVDRSPQPQATPKTLAASAHQWLDITPSPSVQPPVGPLTVPILLYHEPPGNFEQQLDYLQAQNYTTVDLDQVAAALAGTGRLPDKPVVITFDDGLTSQWSAFEMLRQHNMKATFYIINGGSASRWCIGASRHKDPVQPPEGCGDDYLSWSQIRTIDQSKLVTIAAHTVDHEDLVLATPEQRRYQIRESKAGMERELKHPVRHFAYPYGSYNPSVAEEVRQAGYITAVTTMPGTKQDPDEPLELKRIRDAFLLP